MKSIAILALAAVLGGKSLCGQAARLVDDSTTYASSPLAREMLTTHNIVRSRLGVAPLVWSDELAKMAQRWADALISTGDFAHRGDRRYGENLYEISGGSATSSAVVSAWTAEMKDYNPGTNTCSARCGHFTQVIWRDTKAVGCGVARDTRREVWVCNYDPEGNIIGERPY